MEIFLLIEKFPGATKIDRLCLHAGEIEFKLTIEGKTVNFFADAPLPRSLGKLLL